MRSKLAIDEFSPVYNGLLDSQVTTSDAASHGRTARRTAPRASSLVRTRCGIVRSSSASSSASAAPPAPSSASRAVQDGRALAFPPQTRTPTRAPSGTRALPLSRPASAAAPPGSATSWASSQRKRWAARMSSSVTSSTRRDVLPGQRVVQVADAPRAQRIGGKRVEPVDVDRAAGLPGRVKRRRALRLDPDDGQPGHLADGRRHAGDQPAAAHRHQQVVERTGRRHPRRIRARRCPGRR